MNTQKYIIHKTDNIMSTKKTEDKIASNKCATEFTKIRSRISLFCDFQKNID